jgi:hypothetical protein
MTAERGSEGSKFQPFFFQFFALEGGQAIHMEADKETGVIGVHKYGLGDDGIPEPVDYLEFTKQGLERYKQWFLNLPQPEGPKAAAKMYEVARFLTRADLMFEGDPFTP